MKKIMLLAAVAAVAAMALPAIASAQWNDNGTPILNNVTVGLTGEASFSGGVECPVSASVTFEPGTTGKVHAFTVTDTSKCVVIGLLEALGCEELTKHEPTNLPNPGWTVHTNTETITITEVLLHNEFIGTGLCEEPIPVTLEGQVTAVPNNPNNVSSVTLVGELESGLGPVEVSGNLTVDAPNTGTYGI